MRISDSLVEKLLNGSGKVGPDELKNIKSQGDAEKKPLQDLVVSSGLISDVDLTKLYAEEIDVPFIDLNPKEIKREVLRLIPERVAVAKILFGLSDVLCYRRK